jgi:hypothetical protein
MHFDHLPAPLADQIRQQLQVRLTILAGDEPDPPVEFSLRESFRTWILDLGPTLPAERTLESFRRQVDLWDHQIWGDGEPRYIARSTYHPEAAPAEIPIRLCYIARSPLAAQIDATLAWVDAHAAAIGEPTDQDWLVRQLIAPRFGFFALGFFESEEIRKVVTLLVPGEEAPQIIDAADLPAQIFGRSSAFGVASE